MALHRAAHVTTYCAAAVYYRTVPNRSRSAKRKKKASQHEHTLTVTGMSEDTVRLANAADAVLLTELQFARLRSSTTLRDSLEWMPTHIVRSNGRTENITDRVVNLERLRMPARRPLCISRTAEPRTGR
jgi:hypothetical protein